MARGNDNVGAIAEEGELFCTHIGGAASIEGIMMRGKLNWAVAVRRADGTIYLEEHDLPKHAPGGWRTWPILRGCVAFVQSMALSYKAMEIASDHAYDDEGESWFSLGQPPVAPKAQEPAAVEGVQASAPATDAQTSVPVAAPASPADDSSTPSAAMGLGIALGLVLGIALFVALPVGLSNLIVGDYTAANAISWNLVEAIVRIVLFVGYIWLIAFMPDIARTFGYHGAEHQSIHCYEHGEELTPANCARYSRLHVRCGTAFILMTVLVAIVVNTFLPTAAIADALGATEGIPRSLVVFATRLLMMPIVAGLSYEVTVKWAGSHPTNPVVRVVLWPGLQMQRLTTRVPDEGMLECAIAALGCVRDREAREGVD